MKIGSSVFVLSLGETRIMDIRNKNKKHSYTLEEGSIFELSWDTNNDYKHRIRKQESNTKLKTRLGLTFRSIHTFKSQSLNNQ
jgi:alkylated DNA repair dioxygenase AlkB